MKFSLRLLESDQEITKQILSSLKFKINDVFTKAKSKILKEIKPVIESNIKSEPEYNSLIAGQLKYELGIPNAQMVDKIISIWTNNIHVENKPIKITSNQLIGGFSINMIQSDYSDVLSSSEANIIDTNTGSVVPWLDWLLLRGGDIVVADYEVKIGPNSRSRTGMAVMVSSNENYRIPAQFAGTEQNNWVYRAISKIDNSTIQNIIQNALEKSI